VPTGLPVDSFLRLLELHGVCGFLSMTSRKKYCLERRRFKENKYKQGNKQNSTKHKKAKKRY
jgi:hypothetical protein